MGDRRQVVINEGAEKVFLYTHWAGYDLPEIVVSALRRGKDRWNDAPYLTRIILCEMVKGNPMETTGVGIWSSNMDSERPDIFIDIGKQTVTVDGKCQSIAEYAATTEREIK